MEALTNYITSKDFAMTIILIVITIVAIGLITGFQRSMMKKLDLTTKANAFAKSVFKLVKYVVIFIAVLGILQVNNVNISSIIAGVGVAGAVLGFAMQDILKDIIMGFHIINDGSLGIGEIVKIGDVEGEVMSFTLLATQIKDINTGDFVTICNRDITQVSKTFGMYDFDIPLAYDSDGEKVKECLTEAARRIDDLIDVDRAEYLGLIRYDDSAKIYKIRMWCSPRVKYPMNRAGMAEIEEQINKYGLSIPFNRVDIHNV